MKYPRCQYYQKRTCEAPAGRHTFDKGCRGHKSTCQSYVADIKPQHNICRTHNCKITECDCNG